MKGSYKKSRNIDDRRFNNRVFAELDIVAFFNDEGYELKLNAQVVWNEFGLIGLCFEKQSKEIQKQINKLSSRLLSSISPKGNPELA